jgi:hypothetical protein
VKAADRFLHRYQGNDHRIAGPAAGVRGIRQLVAIDSHPAEAPYDLQGIFSTRGSHPGLSGENNLPVNFEESYFSSSIGILEHSHVDVRGWRDYPSFYAKCPQHQGWRCKLESAARSAVMSQDTGMAMTLIGYRGFTRRPSH